MSGYHGRTGPNFSHYINNLNPTSQAYEQEFLPADDLNLDRELALFTNTDFTDFTDFDNLRSLPDNGLSYVLGNDNKPTSDIKYEDLLATATLPSDPEAANVPYYPAYPPTISTALTSPDYSKDTDYSSPTDSQSGPTDSTVPPNDVKHVSGAIPVSSSRHGTPDQQSRLAAEEDKRRRNTAASARFRVKKKQREQALERTLKEVNDQNTTLEARVSQLEMENSWLKNLITEKNGKQTEQEIAAAYQEFRRESEERDLSKNAEGKKGVGTRV